MDALGLLVIFAAIVLALRFHVPIGLTMFGAGLLAALWYRVPVSELASSYFHLLGSQRFLSLTAVVVLVTLLGYLLRELGYLNRLTAACLKVRGGKRSAALLLPSLIGLMPMPAGALLSAPLVDNVLAEPRYTPRFRLVINYWFRHLAEFSWPIYPGIILTEAITGMPIAQVTLMQVPMTLVMALVGILFFGRHIAADNNHRQPFFRSLREILIALWPVLLALVLYGGLSVPLWLALSLSIVVLAVSSRQRPADVWRLLVRGFSVKLILLVFGVLSFQSVLETSGAIETLPGLVSGQGLPAELVIVLVCFISGLLTGMVAAFVGIGYTLLAGLLYQPVLHPEYILLAYISGYLGILLAPGHLCLALTCEFFKVNMTQAYRQLILPVALLGLAGFLLYLSGYGGLFGL
ncbi:MAG: DUF401 family protein [candidate division Zixibacteria bacterium]|nr:DUF401 family protein [candidate division Zixibacteria bacterium]